MARHGHHPASHAARKGIAGSPHTKGMPAGYLAGHGEDHLNAHNTHAGHLSRSHDHLQEETGSSADQGQEENGSM